MSRSIISFIGSVLVLQSLSISSSAHNKVVVIPVGGEETPTSKIVFITDDLHDGDFGGPAGADDFCQAQADQAGSKAGGKKFKAWISGGLATGMQNNGRTFIRSSVPYETVNGVLVANDFADLLDHTQDLYSRLHYTQFGEAIGGSAWTGLYIDGAEHVSDCNGWTSGSFNDDGFSGSTNALDFKWTSNAVIDCQSRVHLICLEQ